MSNRSSLLNSDKALSASAINLFGFVDLPDQWRWDVLGNLCRIRRGASPRPAGDPRYFGGNIPWIKIGDATASGGRYLYHTAEFVNEEGAKRSVRVPKNALIISNSGVSLGFAVITAVEGCVHDGWLITDEFNGLDQLFLYYVINFITKKLRQSADGTTQPNLNTGIAKNLAIPVPPLDEQKRITALLNCLDSKIENNNHMNETLEAMVRAIFQSWFVDFDPVRAKAEGRQPWGMDTTTASLFPASFMNTKLGETPVGWQVQGLDNIAVFLNGLALQKYPAHGNEFLPVIKIAELRQGVTAKSGRASCNVPEKYIVKDGDVLFSWSGTLIQTLWAGGPGALNQHLFKVTSDQYPKWFHYFWVEHHLPSFQAIASAKATTMGHIQREHLSTAVVVIPTADILTEADKIISPLFQKMLQCKIESRTLTSLRDSLLSKLVSGEIRIKEAEQKIEEAIA